MGKTFSNQKNVFERAFDCQTAVFNGLTVEWKMMLFIQKLERIHKLGDLVSKETVLRRWENETFQYILVT